MRLAVHLSVGPLKVAVQLGDEPDADPDPEPDAVEDSVVAELIRLGCETTERFGFTPDPLAKPYYTDDEE